MTGEPSATDPLGRFDPTVSRWFHDRFPRPTAIQEAAWPHIASGAHVLLSAPTGSGKTLTAFLWALDQLASGAWPSGETSVLYVSPLKALNNDIQINLMDPLDEIRKSFLHEGREFPDIVVSTRSGDTPQSERQRMLRKPPEILITTPESLNIILSSVRARHMLSNVRTVILDEIHAVLNSKRGTHLITAVERLTLLAGEFQRIAISATVRPMELVGQFVGGRRRVGDGYEPRPVVTLAAPLDKAMDLSVRFPPPVADDTSEDPGVGPHTPPVIWPSLVSELNSIINANRSTLIFVTTRRHAEKLTEMLNDGPEEPVAYAHHGSLSREIRSFVEQSLKGGRLRAIVATNSLELGIDIGQLDQVVMVRTPMTVSSTLQRIGRAGHQVDATSRGILFPLHGRDVVDAAVMARAALEQNIEEASPVVAPLDVLAQVIISMTAMQQWDVDELYHQVRSSWPYRDLERGAYDLVIEMLAGRYADTRIRELRPRVLVDRVDNSVKAAGGVLALLYQSGGTIPDRGYFGLRLAGGGGKVGELDEEFVWERRVGETFYFGSQLWTVTSIGDRDVEVVPGSPGNHIIPFWKAEAQGRGSHYASMTLEFLEQCESALKAERLDELLIRRPELDGPARQVLAETLARQRAATGTALPHRHNIVVEHYFRSPEARIAARGRHNRSSHSATGGENSSGQDAREVIIHCPWGMGVTQPFSLVLAALWEEERGYPLEVFADDGCVVLLLPSEFGTSEAFGPSVCRKLLRPKRVENLLRARLEQSGLFGALFRENAGRALLLPKGGFNRRMPLWLNRIRSKKLLGAVRQLPDFPILLETWRNCLQDHFDLDSLRALLAEIATGAIQMSECETQAPSPFAADVVWRQTDLYMYQDDSLPGGRPSNLSEDLLREAARNAAIRPQIPEELARQLEARLQRLAPGYAPLTESEIVEWVKERVAVPASEVLALHEAVVRDADADQQPCPSHDRLCWVARDSAEGSLLVAIEQLGNLRTVITDLEVHHLRDLQPTHWWVAPPGGGTGKNAAAGPSAELAELASVFLAQAGAGAEPAAVFSQWLRFYGPRESSWAARAIGIPESLYDDLITDLTESETVIVGTFTESAPESQLCDGENLEHLLLMLRRTRRPVFSPVPPANLVALWADTTGISPSGRTDLQAGDPDQLVSCLETLFGFPAPAQQWESDIIPCRLSQYYPVWLDGLFKETGLTWFGAGYGRLAFALADDIGLLSPRGSGDADPHSPGDADQTHDGDQHLLSFLHARRDADFWEIKDALGGTSEELTARLWAAAWAGQISNDSFETIRQGSLSRFSAEPVAQGPAAKAWPGQRRATRGRRNWAATRPLSGRWFALGPGGAAAVADREDEDTDPISELESAKERARFVLARYGVVFRSLLERELPWLRWGRLFAALRLMELSGEVVAGGFVTGVTGIQFALPAALTAINEGRGMDGIFWMSAADPASPCGLALADSLPSLPPRLPSNHLVFRDGQLVMISRRHGAELEFIPGPDDPDLGRMLAPIRNMVGRRWNPRTRVTVETINHREARESPYADALIRAGFRHDHRRLVLAASYR